jgi:hypothetical protein
MLMEIHTYMYACMHADGDTYIHMHAVRPLQKEDLPGLGVYTYIHICIHTYIHAYTHIHTYIYTYTYSETTPKG